MCSSHQPEEGADSQDYRTPEWAKYWSDPSAPHPDAGRPQKGNGPATERVWSPLGQPGNKGGRKAYYCHHYRAADEHWHSSLEELERCRR